MIAQSPAAQARSADRRQGRGHEPSKTHLEHSWPARCSSLSSLRVLPRLLCISDKTNLLRSVAPFPCGRRACGCSESTRRWRCRCCQYMSVGRPMLASSRSFSSTKRRISILSLPAPPVNRGKPFRTMPKRPLYRRQADARRARNGVQRQLNR